MTLQICVVISLMPNLTIDTIYPKTMGIIATLQSARKYMKELAVVIPGGVHLGGRLMKRTERNLGGITKRMSLL